MHKIRELSSKMRKKIHIFFLVVISLFFTGCSAYVDQRREAGRIASVGQSSANQIAICYNPLFSDENDLAELAKEKCATKNAVLKNYKLFNCTLFYPNTVFYTCK